VYKNDEKTVDEIRAMNPRGILVSPGPGKQGLTVGHVADGLLQLRTAWYHMIGKSLALQKH
jgi:anthranilate/para-aminobenzoate synthase component II